MVIYWLINDDIRLKTGGMKLIKGDISLINGDIRC